MLVIPAKRRFANGLLTFYLPSRPKALAIILSRYGGSPVILRSSVAPDQNLIEPQTSSDPAKEFR